MPGPLAALGLQLGGQAASQLISGGIGQIYGKMDDRRQYKLQEKLQQLGISGEQQMVDYNYAKQLQMWKDTNYSAQMEQLEKAGLNPGLIYGMSGGGGTTTGHATGGTGQAQAGRGAGAAGMGIHSIAELALLNAQKENIEADTKKKEVETTKTAGVDTKLTETQTQSLAQGIENAKAQQKLTEIQQQIAQLDVDFLKDSFQNRLSQININLSKSVEEVRILENEKIISEATVNTKIGLIKLEYANKVLEGYLTKAKTENVNQDTIESITRLKMMIQQNMREWDKLSLQQRQQNIEDIKQFDDQGLIPKELKDAINIFVAPRLGGKHTPISGFHNR